MLELNYHTEKWFSENLLWMEMNKTKIKMSKPIYIGLSIWEVNKTVMYEFWYDYTRLKYQDKTNLCYIDMDSFILNIKTEDFLKTLQMILKIWYIQPWSWKTYTSRGGNKKNYWINERWIMWKDYEIKIITWTKTLFLLNRW